VGSNKAQTAHEATEANATCEQKTDHVQRGMVIFIVVKAARMLGGALNVVPHFVTDPT
jgi:hypothetical protein